MNHEIRWNQEISKDDAETLCLFQSTLCKARCGDRYDIICGQRHAAPDKLFYPLDSLTSTMQAALD